MNLSNAKASLKMKEIGVKKTLGATRRALIVRFLSESLLTTFLSLLVAIPLVILLLPRFNGITGKHLHLTAGPTDMLALVSVVLLTGLLSGSYPAFYLSGFKPLAVLKGKYSTSLETLWVRKGLVVFQFALSVIFIVGLLVVSGQGGSEQTTIEQLQKLYGKFLPGYTFDYHFMDQDYQSLYDSENKVAVLSKYFTVIAILISCLGLYGFAAYTTERRQKEIGIRKVLGASVGNVMALLSKEFIYLVLIAMIIAGPLAWYMLNRWLQNFASRIAVEWWMFALAGVVVAFVAIGFHTVKAAIANPVDSLKTE
jgi:ABC-type antimicrobial peptide transport system permease subunit